MAAFSMRSPTWHVLGISLFLLLVFLQMLTSLVYYAGVFIQSNEVPKSQFLFGQHGEQSNIGSYSQITTSTSSVLLIPCFYVPVVLVPFALLGLLLAAYAKDRTTLVFSMACQAASSSLSLTGLLLFLLLNLSYLNRKDLALSFWAYVGVPVELAITTLLTATVSKKNLPSDWE